METIRSSSGPVRGVLSLAITAICVGAAAILVTLPPSTVRAAGAADEEAVRVFRQMKPTVVSLDNAEGSGTGIIVSADGTVLTNAHVVSSPLPYEIKVDTVDAAGKPKVVAFKHVEVIGYHPRLDLALVRIDPKELAASRTVLKPAVISKVKGDPGQRVYVIGDPAGGNTVLAKSITSGMLSAVDREVEGEKYYQTDAAINPGNSGGPICDRAGKVLGLVTFKFTDVQAIGFAIPLHDVDLKKFVPLTERKADPHRADELLKQADTFSEMATEAGKREGVNSPDCQRLNYYAAYCYRQALAYDPANAELYYNVGMLLRSIDEDGVAAAYLARGIQLRPWDNNGSPYREMGLSLAKQKKDEQALAAWYEGMSKFPYNTKIWEDLAIFHITHQHFLDAAEAASIAVLISEKDTRVSVMKQVVADATRAPGTSEIELLKKTAPEALTEKLDSLLAASNAGRKGRKLYLTKPFADLVTEMGGSSIPGVEQKIDQVPIKRLPELASIAPGPGPAAASAGDAGSGGAIGGKGAGTKSGSPGATAVKPAAGTSTPGKAAAGGDDWLGGKSSGTAEAKPAGGDGTGGKTVPAGKTPEPTVTGQDLAKPARPVVDAQAASLDVKGVNGVEWTADGTFAFIAQEDGFIRKVAVADLKEERHLEIGAECTGIGRCKLGLVVGVAALQEVWLLDEDLAVKKRVTAAGLTRMAASPALSTVYAAAADDRLNVLDMAAGRSVAQITPRDFTEQRGAGPAAGSIAFRMFALTPDGKYFMCEGSESLHRLRVSGTRLFYEEGGPRIGQNPQQIVVSADSRYVALPSGGGNYAIPGQKKANYATYVFRCQDLKTPVITIESGNYPRTLGFDAAGKCLYAQNYEKALIVYSPDGSRGKEYPLPERGDATQRFYVHPDGKKLFVQMSGGLTWMTLP